MRLRISPQSNPVYKRERHRDHCASMRLRISPQSNAALRADVEARFAGFNEAADFAAEQLLVSSYSGAALLELQ